MDFKFIRDKSSAVFGIIIAVTLVLVFLARDDNKKVTNEYVVDYGKASEEVANSILHFAGIPQVTSDKEIKCLSENIYREAENQPIEGMVAVGHVVINRMESGKFPLSACGVIKQKTANVCQFSWNCQKKLRKIDYNSVSWQQSYAIAYRLLNGTDTLPDPTGNAMFYHADYVRPQWGKSYTKTKTIGNHIFYKQKNQDI